MPQGIVRSLACAFLVLGTLCRLPAQPATEPRPLPDALKWRGNLAEAVAGGMLTPEAGLGLMQTVDSPSGLKIDPDADRALAEIDVGQRLVVLRNATAAEKFFQAAEQRLERLVQRAPETAPRDKALYFAKLALIRGNYLNKARRAMLDIDTAMLLQPENRNFQRARLLLANANAPVRIPPKPEGLP